MAFTDAGTSLRRYFALEPNRDYWWMVKAIDRYGNITPMDGGWSHFKTGNIPGRFYKLNNYLNWNHTAVLLEWESAPHARFYYYCMSEKPEGPGRCTTTWTLANTPPQTVWLPVQPNKRYCWQIRAAIHGNTPNEYTPANGNGEWRCFRT